MRCVSPQFHGRDLSRRWPFEEADTCNGAIFRQRVTAEWGERDDISLVAHLTSEEASACPEADIVEAGSHVCVYAQVARVAIQQHIRAHFFGECCRNVSD
jgi:hypothetical protein